MARERPLQIQRAVYRLKKNDLFDILNEYNVGNNLKPSPL